MTKKKANKTNLPKIIYACQISDNLKQNKKHTFIVS